MGDPGMMGVIRDILGDCDVLVGSAMSNLEKEPED